MTRDPAAQAVHERLSHLAANMPEPDVEAGWAALAAQLDPPVALVVPLRRHRPRRALALGIAAAIVIAGSAFAVVRHVGGNAEERSPGSPSTIAPRRVGLGQHLHGAFSGPLADGSEIGTADHGDPSGPPSPTIDPAPSGDDGGDTQADPTEQPSSQPTPPPTGDHGQTGGSNDDQGTGNDQGEDTQGNGDGSSGDSSGGDQGSTGGQGSSNERPIGSSHGTGEGPGSSESHGPGGGNGSNGQ